MAAVALRVGCEGLEAVSEASVSTYASDFSSPDGPSLSHT